MVLTERHFNELARSHTCMCQGVVFHFSLWRMTLAPPAASRLAAVGVNLQFLAEPPSGAPHMVRLYLSLADADDITMVKDAMTLALIRVLETAPVPLPTA